MTDLRRGFEFDRLVVYVDDQGEKVSDIDGDPAWASSDSAVVNVISPPVNPASEHAGDPFWATIQALGPVGSSAEVSATADADLGSGVTPVTVRGDVNVISGQATSGRFTDSEPREIPAA